MNMRTERKRWVGGGPALEGGPTLSQERELKAFLQGLKVEFEGEETDELEGSAADEMFIDMIDEAIETWAAYWDVEINEDAELCEPDSNAYATGMNFRHYAHFTCFAILTNNKHIHISWKSGYVGNKNYYHVEEVRLEEVRER